MSIANNVIHITKNGHEKLLNELDTLIKVEREAVKKAIQEAREHGDLKENAEYHSAKEKQSIIEGRIMELQHKIANAQIIDVKKVANNKIVFGATVTLYDIDKDQNVTYQIVGPDEADIAEKKISYLGPLGKSLLGREVGDTAIVKAPKGDIEYEIEKIEYI